MTDLEAFKNAELALIIDDDFKYAYFLETLTGIERLSCLIEHLQKIGLTPRCVGINEYKCLVNDSSPTFEAHGYRVMSAIDFVAQYYESDSDSEEEWLKLYE